MMVDDDNVAFHRLAPHLRDKTPLKLAALLPNASIRARVEFMPKQAGLRKFGQLRAVARLRSFFPRRHRAILFNLVKPAQPPPIGKVLKLFAAQIIVAAFPLANGKASRASARLDSQARCPPI